MNQRVFNDIELLRKYPQYDHLVGIDEVGRGAIAGPLVVGAAVYDMAFVPAPIQLVRDSKTFAPPQRNRVFKDLIACKDKIKYGIGFATSKEVDEWGLTYATTYCAIEAVSSLIKRKIIIPNKTLFIFDGAYPLKEFPWPQVSVIKADNLHACVSCASIIVKEIRDNWMNIFNQMTSGKYGWDINKGYYSIEQARIITTEGPHPFHRVSFEPTKSYVRKQNKNEDGNRNNNIKKITGRLFQDDLFSDSLNLDKKETNNEQ